MPLISMVKNAPDLEVVNGYVALLQRFLVMNGVLKPPAPGIDPVNGKFDDATELAVERFQRSIQKVRATGVVDEGTWAAIAGVSSPLTVVASNSIPPFLPLQLRNDTDSVVTVLQRLLVEFSGDLPGQHLIKTGIITKANVNGSFGQETEDAVWEFQKNVGLPNPDGRVGNNTWMKLLFPRIPVLPRHP